MRLGGAAHAHLIGLTCGISGPGAGHRPTCGQQGPRVPRPGPVGQVAWLSETIVAFARWCLCGIETAITFAGEKWALLVQFSGAKVMAVSAGPCWGCAVVLLVSTSPCFCVLYAKNFALLGLMWVRAGKGSPRKPKMGKICCFQARWASFFAEMRLEGLCGASFSRTSSRGIPPGECVAPCAWQPGPSAGSVNPSMRS